MKKNIGIKKKAPPKAENKKPPMKPMEAKSKPKPLNNDMAMPGYC